MDGSSLDAADRWVDDWQAKIETRLARTRALATELRSITGTGVAGDGLVEAVVDSTGALLDLRLDEGVRRHSGEWIAGQVLAAVRAARGELVRRSADVTRQSGEAETAEGRAILDALTAGLDAGDR